MWRPLELFIAFWCAAISWPVIGRKQIRKDMRLGWLPIMPDQAKLDEEKKNPDNSWFHLKKDLWVNSVREDAEWWGKFLAMVIAIQALIIVLT